MVCKFLNGMVCPPATSEAGARWQRFSLVVVATTSCCDNKVQMIRPLDNKGQNYGTLKRVRNAKLTTPQLKADPAPDISFF
jgi:hypothetical protein